MVRSISSVPWHALLLLSLALACTAKGGSDDPFGVPAGPGGSSPAPDGDDDDDEGEESDSGSSSADPIDASDTGATSDAPMPDPTTGAEPEPDPTTGMGDQGGDPPNTGMYASCLVPQDCTAPTNVCIVVNDVAGFCTNMACTDPVNDCDPPPGGTATPICFPIELNGMPTASCALGCAGGLSCPAGMTCWPLAEGSICA